MKKDNKVIQKAKDIMQDLGWSIQGTILNPYKDTGIGVNLSRPDGLDDDWQITLVMDNSMETTLHNLKAIIDDIEWKAEQLKTLYSSLENLEKTDNINESDTKITEQLSEDEIAELEFQNMEEQEEEKITEYIITFKDDTELYKQFDGEFITETKKEADDLFAEIMDNNEVNQVEQYISKDWIRYYDPFEGDYTDWEEDYVEVFYNAR